MGRRSHRILSPLALLPWVLACSAAPQGARAPRDATTDEPEGAGPVKATETPQSERSPAPRADVLYAAHPAVPPAPASCVAGLVLPERAACPDARADLADALAQTGAARDAALSALERCDAFEAGLLRALRADLGPAECADVLVAAIVGEDAPAHEPVVSSAAHVALAPDVREALVGLGLAARLRRLAGAPPAAPAQHDKPTLEEYFKSALFPWIERQAGAIYAMASQGKELHGYAKGVVAVEAGNADMRFVEIARDAPIADEIAQYPEARDVYYATLDERLEPRKGRGSAAALVGLREMAHVGVRTSERVASARSLLSRAYGGRRVNALDTLLLPPVPAEQAKDATAAIASRVPTVYATALVGAASPSEHLVRAHLQMGMPTSLRREVETGAGGPVTQLLLGRALFEQGRTYFRAQDFQDAHQLLTRLLDRDPEVRATAPSTDTSLTKEQREEALLLRALSTALLAGPRDAAEMIARGPRFADALGNLIFLDGIAGSASPQAGRAAFNAAYLRELVVPPADPDAWRDLAARYGAAAERLSGPEARWAKERANACRDIEKTVRAELKSGNAAGPEPKGNSKN